MNNNLTWKIRKLRRNEIAKIWTLDRGEVVENTYSLQNGNLVLQPKHYEILDWPAGQIEKYTPILIDCLERGGTFYGMFQDKELIGVSVLDNKYIGRNKDQLQLKFMYVSRSYRRHGIGKKLFKKTVETANKMKAKKLYVSASPSENTINFYVNLGCRVTQDINQELFELEPKDIHLEYVIPYLYSAIRS